MTRVLFLAERTAFDASNVPANGSGAHVLGTLRQLQAHFEVESVFARPADGQSASSRAKRLVPKRLRGLRQDARFVVEDRDFLRRASAVAEGFRPDVVYERNEWFAFTGARLARRLGAAHVLEVNGLLRHDMATFYRSFGEPLGGWGERWKLRRADAVITVSTGLAERLAELGAARDRLVVVPNSVDDSRILPEPRQGGGSGLVVGWAGHMMSWHSLDLLVDAAPAILEQLPETRFRVVGQGAGFAQLHERVRALGLERSFEFPGLVPYEQITATVAGFDIGVIPANFTYGFPVKLSELGAAGVPVVAPQFESFDEMLAPGVEYAPFVPGSSADLARAVVELGRDADARARLGQALWDAVRERYCWSVVASTLAAAVEGARARR
jgi:glycosyltransferase involved in cell wall biosynthesis